MKSKTKIKKINKTKPKQKNMWIKTSLAGLLKLRLNSRTKYQNNNGNLRVVEKNTAHVAGETENH